MKTSILNQLNSIRMRERKKLLGKTLEILKTNTGTRHLPYADELMENLAGLAVETGNDINYGRAIENYNKLGKLFTGLFKLKLNADLPPGSFHEFLEEATGKIKSFIPEQPAFKPLAPFLFLNRQKSGAGDICIIILHENGVNNLEKLFSSFIKYNSFKYFRIILIDRASSDNSLQIAEAYTEKLPLNIMRFDQKFTASYLYNLAVDSCGPEFLLFLDSNLEFGEDILKQFIDIYNNSQSPGLIGASAAGSVKFTPGKIKGVPDIPYPTINLSLLSRSGLENSVPFYRKEGAVFVRPGLGLSCLKPVPAHHESKKGIEAVAALAGNALFCSRADFISAGGFDLNYIDGLQETDLCLSFRYRLNKEILLAHDIRLVKNNETNTPDPAKKEDETLSNYNLGVLINRHGYYIKDKYFKELTAQKQLRTNDTDAGYSSGQLRIAIKTPAFDDERTRLWGDYHFANSLKDAFIRKGFQARVDLHNYWYDHGYMTDDVVIVLRGTKRYHTRGSQINILWNISHPEQVTEEEYRDYDYVFSASTGYAEVLKEQYGIPAENLLQCTDTGLFYPDRAEFGEVEKTDILFVGNSREVFRKSVEYAMLKGIPADVYGSRWEQFIPSGMIKGDYIKNEELRRFYSNCEILLNDHWKDMVESGFISNRIFDALACGAIVLTDRVKGIEKVFNKGLYYYDDPDEFKEQIRWIRQNYNEAKQLALENLKLVREAHTFDNRAGRILEVLSIIHRQKTKNENFNHHTGL